MQKDEGMMMQKEEGATMQKEEGMMVKYAGVILAGKSAPLIDYNRVDYDAAIKSDKLVVLYFYANWCPICKKEVPELYAAFDALTTENVVGFRVNYNDSETDANEEALAREFGVAYQHTKVFLKNGVRVLKAPDSWEKARYLSEISKALSS
jgi:thiol-disulfide isomerase/thioredoxin